MSHCPAMKRAVSRSWSLLSPAVRARFPLPFAALTGRSGPGASLSG